MIQDNIARILGRIGAVCQRIGRDPNGIAFVAVTKFADVSQIKEVIAAGLTHVGENKVQEARKKFSAFNDPGINLTKHMIGHLQTNKVRPALEVFDCIQSVDSLKLAAAIETQAARLDKNIDILIQVNTAGEQQKFGISPSGTCTLVEQIAGMKHVHLQGLMTIAPLTGEKAIVRKCFRDLRLLRDEVSQRFSDDPRVTMKYLSMGMTDDYEAALEEGSNMVRIGRAVFQA